jgi:hypothetical protein
MHLHQTNMQKQIQSSYIFLQDSRRMKSQQSKVDKSD